VLPESAHQAIIAAGTALEDLFARQPFFCLLFVSGLFLIAGVYARNGFLTVLSVLALSASVGAGTFYGHATYILEVTKPTVTICLFTILSFGALQLSGRVPLDYERIAIIFSTTSLLLVNFAFWVGSLWGDTFEHLAANQGMVRLEIPDWGFAIAWAVGLLLAGIWGARNNRRWVVNLSTVFAAIHFYTQVFERLGASSRAFLFSGLAALGIAFFILRYNRSAKVAARDARAVLPKRESAMRGRS
jgi:hypothetical protein